MNSINQREWKVIFNDDKGDISELNNCKYFNIEGSIVELETFVPRKGEYIVSGDYSSDINEKKCYIVLDVFWNLQRKDIDIYLKEVDKNTYPMHRRYDNL